MLRYLTNKRSVLRRLVVFTGGRPLAALLLLAILLLETIHALPIPIKERLPKAITSGVELIRAPIQGVQLWMFDSYQKILPRQPQSQPATIVAIDEKSLHEFGQWPWPRDVLAKMIGQIDLYQPAAIGLDFYMPEEDQNSLVRLTERLAPEHKYLIKELELMPSSDFQLEMALSSTPSVLGAAGFSFEAYTNTNHLLSAKPEITGSDPLPFVENYPWVLASRPQFQAAAAGQALLSVPAQAGAIRRIPLISAVNDSLVPGLALEMFRVATGSSAIRVTASDWGIQSAGVADLDVETQPNSDVWLHYAPLKTTQYHYLSVVDLMSGNFDPALLQSKLVIIGLTGAGLSDMRFTALGEQVPGIEIQAQLIESLFDGTLLKRPSWLPLAEMGIVLVVGLILVWFVPKSETWLGAILKYRPVWMLGFLGIFSALMLALGFALFAMAGMLFSASTVALGVALVLSIFFAHTMLDNLTDAQQKMARLVENGISLGRLQQRALLLEMTLDGMNDLAPSQAALVFSRSEDGLLNPIAQRNLSEGWPGAIDPDTSNSPGLLSAAFHDQAIKRVSEADDPRLKSEHWPELRLASGEPLKSVLVVPMLLSDTNLRGIVVLINAVDPLSRDVHSFSEKHIPFVEALATQAAVAMENLDLVQAQRKMMDAMIEMIAGAIDAKSPYTGGHCERVPEIATMLCEAASNSNDAPFAEFSFNSDEEWREFKIAAWLHDCGKVTTPEHVVDKATKLETINNRIHEIRTRFEVLLRDAQLEHLKAIHIEGEDPAGAKARFEARKQQLQDDFAFIASCNEGGEFLSDDKIERIRQIGAQTWLRYFDNRIGLSHEELLRYPDSSNPLPCEENLLSDRPEHLIERPPSNALDDKFGFKMEIPEYLYNQGELHNLSVSRGTLTAEERFKINEHIIQTIAILEQMPFPPNLKRVPEIAGAHHETLIGTGYPRQLTRDDLSIPARIMAIADIFEALTASDRPYKKAKTLSESIRILSFFKKDQHIDPDLFDLFLSEGIYKVYAQRYLKPEQIDEVDIEQYLN
ncbi:HD domain-containing phosphohydrolase [Marinobacterium sp. YM272]|uniref:HD domain-containing phosphohydrolase n=1 Tax=Marinobacterium sp. YM272 TaxID=3421654 RepID=UPI003D7F7EB9